MKQVTIRKTSAPDPVVRVRYCDTYSSKLLGLMFSRELEADGGVILADHRESKLGSSIHMLFMNYNLAVIWLDKDMIVVDKILAKKWVPFYLPKKPAQYTLELHPSKLTEFTVGDQLVLMDES